jgi:hypothetical protein
MITAFSPKWLLCFVLLNPPDVLSAGAVLGHSGEWDALRDYLKSSYKASQLGQVSHGTV